MLEITNPVLKAIWKDRYCKSNETLEGNFRRVAKYIASCEEDEQAFFNVMNNGLFLPAGRTMSNCGIGQNLTLNNCFLHPVVQDSMSEIFEAVKCGAMTHKSGGGIGYDFSLIRPNGTKTSNEAVASGVVSFMDVFNAQTATVMQGSRRGANMAVLNIYHPDIVEYITAKSFDTNKLNYFNVSVMVDDEFMEAVNQNKTISLHYPVYDEQYHIISDKSKWKICKEINACELWDLIMHEAYNNGEPGILFYDNMNRDNNTWYTETITHTNPCGEFLGGTVFGQEMSSANYGGACNLGSLLLHNFIKFPFTSRAEVNYNKLTDTIKTAVKMLDNIIDINKYPLAHYENYQKNLRTIGLGITGLADMLAMLGIKYNSPKATAFVDELMELITYTAYKSSVSLAVERGAFPFFDAMNFTQSNFLKKHVSNQLADMSKCNWSKLVDDIKLNGIRNARLISIAPTGTMSLTYGNNCSSGIEPIFSLSYDRKVKIGGQSEDNTETIKMQDYAYGLYQDIKASKFKCEVTEDVFVTAMDMSVDSHIDMLSAVAFHVDMSISKTINVPTEYSFEETKDIYMKCWKNGVKGCTIFRPNSIRQGVLMTDGQKDKNKVGEDSTKLERGDVIQVSDDVIGLKRKLITGCGSLHCSAFFDRKTGCLLETYLSKGSTGGCANFMTGLSRMISLSARSGCAVQTITDQLYSCGVCPSYAVRSATKGDTSKGSCCPIAVGNALTEMYMEVQSQLGLSDEINHATTASTSLDTGSNCPECGDTILFEGGCNICKSCGWSKCN